MYGVRGDMENLCASTQFFCESKNALKTVYLKKLLLTERQRN